MFIKCAPHCTVPMHRSVVEHDTSYFSSDNSARHIVECISNDCMRFCGRKGDYDYVLNNHHILRAKKESIRGNLIDEFYLPLYYRDFLSVLYLPIELDLFTIRERRIIRGVRRKLESSCLITRVFFVPYMYIYHGVMCSVFPGLDYDEFYYDFKEFFLDNV